MSDRCVFLPYRDARGQEDAEWADVVIPQGATIPEIEAAADVFGAMGGPHKIFLRTRNDWRFGVFVGRLSEEHAMDDHATEGRCSGWCYSVILQGELPA